MGNLCKYVDLVTPQTFNITCDQSRLLAMTYKAMLGLCAAAHSNLLPECPHPGHMAHRCTPPTLKPLLTELTLSGVLFLYCQDFCLSKAQVVVLLQLSGVLLCRFESRDCDLMIVLGLKLCFIISLETMGITISAL